jgi:16S rRNA (uracil1498-N3)-methyltransferase
MSRFFIPPEQIHHQKFFLEGPEARHAAIVLRKKAGDAIDLFDGKDLSYSGRIESITSDRVEGVILSEKKSSSGSGPQLILCQALIKGPKWDWLVEKACEIGVAKLVPLLTARTVVKPSKSEPDTRSQRIALAAAKQCGRSDLMDIVSPKLLTQALQEFSKEAMMLIPWEKETERTVKKVVSGGSPKIAVFIGPEGGWENGEVELAMRYGAIPVTLGSTLLRSETAGLVASALVMSA